MKKTLSLLFSFALIFTLSFTQNNSQVSAKTSLDTFSEIAANDPERIKEVLQMGFEVDMNNSESTYVFEDGSSITVSIDLFENKIANYPYFFNSKSNLSNDSLVTTSSTQYITGSMSISGSNVLGTLWRYTLYQDYITDGSKLTWYESSPYSGFEKPMIISLWELTDESLDLSSNPLDSKGIRATANIKLKYDVLEIKGQTVSAKLTLDVKGNGSYSGYVKWL